MNTPITRTPPSHANAQRAATPTSIIPDGLPDHPHHRGTISATSRRPDTLGRTGPLRTGVPCGGALGAACASAAPCTPAGPPATSLDLTCRGDVQLFKRAVANGWEVPPEVMEQVLAQVPRALQVLPDRSKFELIRALIRLDGRYLLALGLSAGEAGVGPAPFPESRRRRRRRA